MTADDGKPIPPEVLGQVLEQLCRDHLDGTAPLPLEALDTLCETFLAMAEYTRSRTNEDAPGVHAAHAAEFLVMIGMSETRAAKTAAKQFNIPVRTVQQNYRRLKKVPYKKAPDL